MSIATDIIPRVDVESGISINYRIETNWYDGTPITDTRLDGDIFRKKGSIYYQKTIDKKTFLKINTIADLRLQNGYYEGQEVILLGYYESGDKYPLNYKFTIENFNTNIDDGGSVIKSTRGSWIAQFGKEIDPRDFGAKNDGSVDNIPFVRKAMSYIDSIGGGVLAFSEGSFKFSGTYKPEDVDYNAAYNARLYDGVQFSSNITFKGVKNKTKIMPDETCACVFTSARSFISFNEDNVFKNVAFIDLDFIENPVFERLRENTAPIMIGGIDGLTVTGCRWIGWKGDALNLGENNNSDLSWQLDTIIKNVNIYDNIFDGVSKDNRQAITLMAAENVNIYDNSFYRCTRVDSVNPIFSMPGAIDYEPILSSSKLNGLNIYNNYFDDVGGSTAVVTIAQGLDMDTQGSNVTIKNNTFNNCTNEREIYVAGRYATTPTGVDASILANVFIENNIFNSNTKIKVECSSVNGLSIKNNSFTNGYNSYGIIIGYSTISGRYGSVFNMKIKDNYFNGIVKEGNENLGVIYLLGNAFSSNFDNNIFNNSGNMQSGVLGRMIGIQFLPSSDLSKNITIENNTFINSAFNVDSPAIFSVPLNESLTFSVKNNSFKGFSEKVYTDSDSIYRYVNNSDTFSGYISAPNAPVLNVSGGSLFILIADNTTSITGGHDGSSIRLTGKGGGSLVTHGNNIHLNSDQSVTLYNNMFIDLVNNGGQWYEVGRMSSATTTTIGGVKMGASVPDGSTIDTLLISLRNAGIINS